MNTQTFDTIVIGSGSSAYFAITALNNAGQKVAVIDERPYGGTCALRGCQPKKYLVANAEAVAMAEHLQGIGLTAPPKTNWAALQKHKNAFLEGIPDGEVEEFTKAGIATFHGKAQLVAQDEVALGEERLKAKHIIIATGAVPRRSDIPGAEHLRDSEYFLNMATLPERILFIGGGYIAFEFAHVAARAGASVTILNRSARPLKQFDSDTVDTVMEATKASGIEFVTDESPVRVTQAESAYQLHGKSGKVYDADLIIEATGRVSNVSVLDGEHGKVDHSSREIGRAHV